MPRKIYLYDASGHGNDLVNTHFTHSTGPTFYDVTKQNVLQGADILRYYDLNIMSGSDQINSTVPFINKQYASASLHDNNNRSQIKNLIPAWLTQQDADISQGGIGYLQAHLHIIARELDGFKVFIDQFPNVLSSKHQRYDKTPSAFLELIAENFGFPFKTMFDFITPSEWFNELRQQGDESTIKTDIQDINNVFWQRILTNLGYIYKKKGTRELLEAMMRIYGIPQDIFRIIELGGTLTKPEHDKVSEIRTVREYAIRPYGSDDVTGKIRALPKTATEAGALNIGAGAGGQAPIDISAAGPESITVAARFRLNDTVTNTYQTIWEMRGSSSLKANGSGRDANEAASSSYMTLYVDTSNVSNYPPTASVVLIATRSLSTAGTSTPAAYTETPVSISLKIAPFSKSLAHNTFVSIMSSSTSPFIRYALKVKRADTDFINNTSVAVKAESFQEVTSYSDSNARGYISAVQWSTPQSWSFGSGSYFNRRPGPGEKDKWDYLSAETTAILQGSINAFRIWGRDLSDSETDHHSLNYRSFATDLGISSYDDVKVAYAFEENQAVDSDGNTPILDASTNSANASGSDFTAGTNPYIAYNSEILSVFPFFDDGDLGVENIRTFKAKKNLNFLENNKFGVAFEANLTDELRRDQADLIFNFDTLNTILSENPGQSAKEDTYNALEDLRKTYFNKRWRVNQTLKLNEYNQAMKYLAQNLDQVMRTLIPLRAFYAGSFFTVEPHLLERKRNPHVLPNEFITPPVRQGNILSSSFTDLSPLAINTNSMPQELLATQREIDALGVLPTQDEYLRDMVASHDRFVNTLGFTKQIDLDMDLGAIRKTKVRQKGSLPKVTGTTTETPKVVTRYLQPMNPLNTDIANAKTYNQTNLEFNTTTPPASNLDDMWDEPEDPGSA